MCTHAPRTPITVSLADQSLPELVRVSIGSAIVLGLASGRLDTAPTTIYLLTYRKEKCAANCGFCSQARGSTSRTDALSRVIWPVFSTRSVVDAVEKASTDRAVVRVCIQALNYEGVFDDVLNLVKTLRSRADFPLSVSCQPFSVKQLSMLKEAGVERVGIPLDAASKHVFDRVKGLEAGGAYSWETQKRRLLDAVEVFGANRVSTHLIVGLGETEREMAEILQWCVDNGISPGLFAFTPIKGTCLEKSPPPPIDTYRRMQLARYLMVKGFTRFDKVEFDSQDRVKCFDVPDSVLDEIIIGGEPFLTSGCPGCNRPYYNETPGGVLYNYPRPLTAMELEAAREQLHVREDSV